MSRLVLFNFIKLKEFYHQLRELTADEQTEIKQIWKARIKRKEYDDREGVQNLREILADTSCAECTHTEEYSHTTTAHREHQALEEQTRQAVEDVNRSLENYKPTGFAPTPLPKDHQNPHDETQRLQDLADAFANMSTATQTTTRKRKQRQNNGEGPSNPSPEDFRNSENPGDSDDLESNSDGDAAADFLDNVQRGNRRKKVTKIPDPEPFHGDQHKLGRFLLELQLKLNGNKDGFPTDDSKIAYAASLLRGSAAD